MIVKLVLGKEIHLYKGELIFSNIISHIPKVFERVPINFSLSYTDQENDQITITAQEDLEQISSKSLKINISEPYYHLISQSQSFASQNHHVINLNQQQSFNSFISPVVNSNIKHESINQSLFANSAIYQEFCRNPLQQGVVRSPSPDSVSTERKSRVVRSRSLNSRSKEYESTVSDLVEQKVNKLLPNIIEEVQTVINKKIIEIDCFKCQKSSLEIEQLINRQFRNKTRKLKHL